MNRDQLAGSEEEVVGWDVEGHVRMGRAAEAGCTCVAFWHYAFCVERDVVGMRVVLCLWEELEGKRRTSKEMYINGGVYILNTTRDITL